MEPSTHLFVLFAFAFRILRISLAEKRYTTSEKNTNSESQRVNEASDASENNWVNEGTARAGRGGAGERRGGLDMGIVCLCFRLLKFTLRLCVCVCVVPAGRKVYSFN